MQLGAPKVAIGALLSSAVLAIVLAAQMTCTDKMAIPMPAGVGAMPGMDMSTMQTPGQAALMICPVVLALIVASAAFALAAVTMMWRVPRRAPVQRAIAAAAPPVRLRALAVAPGGHAVPLLAAGRGLRAPPFFVR